MSVSRRLAAASIVGMALVAGCTGSGKDAGPRLGSPPVSAAVAACTPTDTGEAGRPGRLVYLAATTTTVQTQQGFEVVVHPARGDKRGKRWRLAVTKGSSRLCRLTGNFVPSVIAAFIIRSPGIITLKATGPSGVRRLTIKAGA